MAVFTKIKNKEVEKILKLYNIGKLKKIEGILSGTENTNYYLTTNIDVYIITIFEILKKKDILFFLNLLDIMYFKNIKVPKILKKKEKGSLINFKNKIVIISERIIGKNIKETKEKDCVKIGRILGLFHSKLSENYLYKKNNVNFSYLKKKIDFLKNKVKKKDLYFLKRELYFNYKFIKSDFFYKLPSGICHYDLFKDNVFFNKNRKNIKGIIDFYFSNTNKYIFDLAILVNDWCFDNKKNKYEKKKVLLILKNYNKFRKIKSIEIDNFKEALRFSALRFYIMRIYNLHKKNNDFSIKKEPSIYKKIILTIKNGKIF